MKNLHKLQSNLTDQQKAVLWWFSRSNGHSGNTIRLVNGEFWFKRFTLPETLLKNDWTKESFAYVLRRWNKAGKPEPS